MLLLALLGCFSIDSTGIPVLTGLVPSAAASPGALSPADRLGDCTAVPFPGLKVDYQCGDVKVAYVEFRGFDDPLLAAGAFRSQFGREVGPGRSVSVDGVTVDVRAFALPGDDGPVPMWAAFSVVGGRVREALCKPHQPSASAEADCLRVVSILAVHGAVEPRAGAVPPFAGRTITAPAGCSGRAEPGWAGVVSCPDGTELRWRSSPIVKDVDRHLADYDNASFLGTGAEPAQVPCTLDGAEATCLLRSGPGSGGTAMWNALTAYANVRDDGVTVACLWIGAPVLPEACAAVMDTPQ
ncbi:MAG: hypothetical protein Q8P18_03890 [Pseudomonadota bacterium]|nr:hypothetical protein [Pseudomonadota bacterium]